MYHFDGWETLDPSVATTVHKCLHNDIQEPYVRCLGCWWGLGTWWFVKCLIFLCLMSVSSIMVRTRSNGSSICVWSATSTTFSPNPSPLMSLIQSMNLAAFLISTRSKIALDWFAEGQSTSWKTKMHILLDHFVYEVQLNTDPEKIVTPLCSA